MTFYPGCYAALVLLMRRRPAVQSRALLIDGAVSALALAAVAAGLLFEPLRQATGGSAQVLATHLVYPLADYLMLIFVSFIVVLTRRWAGPTVALFIVGFAPPRSLTAAGLPDGQRELSSRSRCRRGLAADGVRPRLRCLAATLAAQARSPHGWSALWVPGSFALIAISLLIYGNLGRLSPPALVLAVATLIAACVRGLSLFMEMKVERGGGRRSAKPATSSSRAWPSVQRRWRDWRAGPSRSSGPPERESGGLTARGARCSQTAPPPS